MIRKCLLSASLGALLILGVSTQARTALQQSQSGQQADQAKQVNGKVTAIGSDKKSFSLDVNDGNNKRTMQFVLDEKTQVQGRVGVGTDATVQYQCNRRRQERRPEHCSTKPAVGRNTSSLCTKRTGHGKFTLHAVAGFASSPSAHVSFALARLAL